ncbi:hypothetical protein HOD75_00530 [archaeon]|jgi:micrococcal nuclease|nr:hypothetical protein [archaeon]MBT4241361.1 hypothetical protein [archaeon]MBT4418182.1 hypothetical protein [archaeon]
MKIGFSFVFVLILIVLVLGSIFELSSKDSKFANDKSLVINSGGMKSAAEKCFVLRVIDGDTIVCDIGEVRLLGVNTPEKGKDYYDEATWFLRGLENRSVLLLSDLEDIDRYGRMLRYVFYEDDLINAKILEDGWGTSFMLGGLMFEDKFLRAENDAKNGGVGLWGGSEDVCGVCVELVELNAVDEYFVIGNICEFDCDLSGWYVKDDANHFIKLGEGVLGVEEVKRFESKSKIWNNDGDRFFMRDGEGGLVVYWEY